MAKTTETTYVSELCVPLGVAIIAYNNSLYDEEDVIELGGWNRYGEIYDLAHFLNVDFESDEEWWSAQYNEPISQKSLCLIERCMAAAWDIAAYVYKNNPPNSDYGVVGRDNDGDWPPDFHCGNDYFSLKDNSNILWNTTPKSLLPYINPELHASIINGEIEFLQGQPLIRSNNQETGYDWFLFADSDLNQRTYSNYITAVFKAFYDIKMKVQPEWNPNGGYGIWWTDDPYDIDGPGMVTDREYAGYNYIPFDESERICFEEHFGSKYSVYLFDGFNEDDYPVTFLGLDSGDKNKAVIPVVMYADGIPQFFFDPWTGYGYFDVGNVINRSESNEGEQYNPMFEFNVNTNTGTTKAMTQANAKILGRWLSYSDYSPRNSQACAVPDNSLPYSLANPVETYETYMSELSGSEMTEIEYWRARMQMNASDALAYTIDDIVDSDEKELIASLLRITDQTYYYVRMYPDTSTDIYRVPDINELYSSGVTISNISFDSDKQNTMITFTIEEGSPVVIEVEFRYNNGEFSGAPGMHVLYDDRISDLSGIYKPV